MSIGIQSKLNELSRCQRTDGSIQVQYNQMHNSYVQAKMKYKSSKQEYKDAEQQLAEAEEYFWNAPMSKKFKIHRQVKIAKRNLRAKKQKYDADREQYKQRLKELKRLKREIRAQYKVHREYVSFFRNVQEAQKLGIQLPKYITDAYIQQKNVYLSQQYTVDKSGQKSYMLSSDTTYNKDTATLIWEKHKENLNHNIQKLTTKVKETFRSSEGIEH